MKGPVILQVLPALDIGGVERGTIEIAQAVVQAGGTALVACHYGRLVPKLEKVGGMHIELDLRSKMPLRALMNAYRLESCIRKHKVELVHARSRAPAWSAKRACRRTGKPFVTTWHGVHGLDGSLSTGKRFYNSALAAGDRVIAISNYIAARIEEEYDVGPERLRIIPRGADTRFFDPDNVHGTRLQALEERWNLPYDKKIIMLPARITEWKGHALLLDALGRLARHEGCPQDWLCAFVGPGDDGFAQSLLKKAEQCGLGGRVIFGGRCDDMPAALALAHVVVVPSLRPEPFGRVVVEAQAMRRVVVVAAHGAAVETVEQNVTGFTFTPGNVEELARTLLHTLTMPEELSQKMGEDARQSVVDRYDVQHMKNATLAVYNELL